MRVLSLVWFKILPAKYGGQKGTAFFNEHLAAHVEVTCLCSRNNVPPNNLSYYVRPELPTSKLQFVNPFCWLKILTHVKKGNTNILILEYPYHAIAGVLAKKLLGVHLILHEHNIEYIRFHTFGKWWWRALFMLERWVARHADLVLFKTEQDLNVAVRNFKLNSEKCVIVPYGVTKPDLVYNQIDIRTKHKILPQQKILLFAGTLDYAPNAKAVMNIYDRLVPELEKHSQLFQILICGRLKEKAFQYLKSYRHPHILFIGEVEDMEPYFAAADIFINPLFYNGGIQTKNLDALSRHCTVIAFAKTVQGLNLACVSGKIIQIENENWKDFAAAIQKEGMQKQETPSIFYQYYNWSTIAEKLYLKMSSLF